MPIDPNAERNVADQLADAIAPRAVRHLREHRDEIVSTIRSCPARLALRMAWAHIEHLVPSLAKVGAETAMDEFGKLSVADIARALVKRARPVAPPAQGRRQPSACDVP